MRYMRWSYDDLMSCPEAYLDVIREQIEKDLKEKQKAAQQQGRRRR